MSEATVETIQQVETATGQRVQRGGNLFDKALCLHVEIGTLGTRRKVPRTQIKAKQEIGAETAAVTVEAADAEFVNVSKAIIRSDKLKAIQQRQNEVRTYLYNMTLRSPFGKGNYLTPIASIREIDAYLVRSNDEVNTMVDEFIEEYPQLCEDARQKLGPMYNPLEYPSIGDVRGSFYLAWNYVQFGVPAQLADVQQELFNREQDKIKRKWDEAFEMTTQLLRGEFLDLIQHAQEKLSGTRDGGKPKVFRDSLVGNIREFFDTFANRNITNDEELDRLVAQAKGLLEGVDAQALRDSDQTRAKVAEGFAELRNQLSEMVTDKPTRYMEVD